MTNTSTVYRTLPNEEIQQAYDQLAPDYDRMTGIPPEKWT
jgi:hypothetical protein